MPKEYKMKLNEQHFYAVFVVPWKINNTMGKNVDLILTLATKVHCCPCLQKNYKWLSSWFVSFRALAYAHKVKKLSMLLQRRNEGPLRRRVTSMV